MVKITKKIVGFSVRGPGEPPPSETTPPSASGAPVQSQPAVEDAHLTLHVAPPPVAIEARPFPRRPHDVNGFAAWTSPWIETDGAKFVVCVSHTDGVPFEVWVMGHEAPPGAQLVAQLLSHVLLTQDRAFVRYHLRALSKAVGRPFGFTMPFTGQHIEVRSVSHAIAAIVEAYAVRLGFLGDPASDPPSPMLDALTSLREPKSHGRFGRATVTDILNPATGEDFALFVKEAHVEGLGVRPVSMWFAGQRQPPESEGICKLVSLAMRHRDPAWAGTFLRALRRHTIVGQELGFASVGNDKGRFYGSTWAYVADLLIHRYMQLGLLNPDGSACVQSMFLFEDAATTVPSHGTPVLLPSAGGQTCPACGSKSTAMMDGCLTCLACGYSKCG
jgi:ribonucleoside-diphosphate reductase alpha chain